MTLSETKHIRGLVSQGTHKDIESSVGWAVGGFEETRASRQAVRIVGNRRRGAKLCRCPSSLPFPIDPLSEKLLVPLKGNHRRKHECVCLAIHVSATQMSQAILRAPVARSQQVKGVTDSELAHNHYRWINSFEFIGHVVQCLSQLDSHRACLERNSISPRQLLHHGREGDRG